MNAQSHPYHRLKAQKKNDNLQGRLSTTLVTWLRQILPAGLAWLKNRLSVYKMAGTNFQSNPFNRSGGRLLAGLSLCLLLLLSSLYPASLIAQTIQFEEFGGYIGGVKYSSIAFADVDGDDDQDAMIAGGNDALGGHSVELYFNNGSGNLKVGKGNSFGSLDQGSLAFADVDGDNDQDLLMTGSNGGVIRTFLYLNNGSGIFGLLKFPKGAGIESVNNSSIAFADVDGDNDQDVLITGFNALSTSIAKLYRNTTTPPPTCNIPTGLAAGAISNTTATLTWADVNRGGDYQVQYKPTIADAAFQSISVTGSNSTTLTGLTPGQQYKFKVQGVCNFSGTTETTTFSNFVFFTTTRGGCVIPVNLTVSSITNTSATLSWGSLNPDLTSYEVEYKPTIAGQPWKRLMTGFASARLNLTGLIPGQQYKYRVRAICDLGGGGIVTTDYSPLFFLPPPQVAMCRMG
jgi:fibronectin type III domain protein/VCBS repeat protein